MMQTEGYVHCGHVTNELRGTRVCLPSVRVSIRALSNNLGIDFRRGLKNLWINIRV